MVGATFASVNIWSANIKSPASRHLQEIFFALSKGNIKMKKILLAAIIAVTSANTFASPPVTSANTFASPSEIARKNLCVNLMVTAHSYIEASKLGMPKSEIKSIIDAYNMQELYELLDLIYHPTVRNGKTTKVWEFVYDHCESLR